MTLLEQINKELVQAIKARDSLRVDSLKMVKTKLAQKKTSKGFSGELTDEVVQEVIASYVKEIQKALKELEAAGDKDSDLVKKYQFEVEYLSKFLPSKLGEEETKKLVQQAIEETGALSIKDKGKVMGKIMKSYKGKVDPAIVSRFVEELLS